MACTEPSTGTPRLSCCPPIELSNYAFVKITKSYTDFFEGDNLGDLMDSDSDDMLAVLESYDLEDLTLFPPNTFLWLQFAERRHPTVSDPIIHTSETPHPFSFNEYSQAHSARWDATTDFRTPILVIEMSRTHCRRPEPPQVAMLLPACRYKTTQTPYNPAIGAINGPTLFSECGVSPYGSTLLETPVGGPGETFYNEDKLMMFDIEPYAGSPTCCDPTP